MPGKGVFVCLVAKPPPVLCMASRAQAAPRLPPTSHSDRDKILVLLKRGLSQSESTQHCCLSVRGDIPHIVAFDNDGLRGDPIHVFGKTPDLGTWGKSIPSMVILAGRWECFDEEQVQGTRWSCGPGPLWT
jgi:hypothetical protein